MDVHKTVVNAVLQTLEQYGAIPTPLRSPEQVRQRVHALVDWIVGDQPGGRRVRPSRPRRPARSAGAGEAGEHLIPRFTVTTNCEFSLSVEADTADAAIEQAQKVPYSDWGTAWAPIEAEQE